MENRTVHWRKKPQVTKKPKNPQIVYICELIILLIIQP